MLCGNKFIVQFVAKNQLFVRKNIMSLYITDGPVPKGAVRLSREEAIKHQWQRIMEWPKQSEVWPFRWGLGGLGLLSAGTGMRINNYYRCKLKIRHQGFLSALMPMFFGPPIFTTFLHIHGVTSDILLQTTKCPLCLNMRAVVVQLACGIAYPVLMGSVINFMLAFQYATYRVPHWKDARGHLGLWLELTRPLGKKLLPIAFSHILVAGFLTYAEVNSLCTIDAKTRQYEENGVEEIYTNHEM